MLLSYVLHADVGMVDSVTDFVACNMFYCNSIQRIDTRVYPMLLLESFVSMRIDAPMQNGAKQRFLY
jgi:hypothetical protein